MHHNRFSYDDDGEGDGESMILDEEIDENYEPTEEGPLITYFQLSYIHLFIRNH